MYSFVGMLLFSGSLYLGSDDFPTEDVQFEAYKSVVQRMNGARVIIRTMDIGADKKIGYFGLADEENPAFGMRALYRASAYGELAAIHLSKMGIAELSVSLRSVLPVRNAVRSSSVN